MTEKKNKSSKLASSLKKGARKLLSGQKALAKFGASLPLLALFVEEVRAAQAKGYKPTDELLQGLPPEVLKEIGVEVPQALQEDKSTSATTVDATTLDEKIQSARESLRAVLEDEISNANTAVSAKPIDPASPDVGRQAVRSVLADEVVDAVAKATSASPDAAVALSTLPDLPPVLGTVAGGFSPSYLFGALAFAGGGGAGGLASQLAARRAISIFSCR